MPNYDETVEFIMPEGRGTAKGTNFTTGSKGGGALAGAVSDEYSRGLEQKRDENIIRDFGMEGLVSYYDKRIKQDQAEQAERDALKTRGLQQEKLAAESMKLTGEALKALSEATAGPTPTAYSDKQAAAVDRLRKGFPETKDKAGVVTAPARLPITGPSRGQIGEEVQRMDIEASDEKAYGRVLAANQAGRDLPSVPGSVRDKLSVLDTTMQGLTQLREEHDPVFTGQEAPMGKMGKFMGMESQAFARFRARAQMIYAPARNDLIGATQSPQEIQSINRVLPPDITALSDLEAVAAIEVLMDMTKTKRNALAHQFKLEQPSPAVLGGGGAHPLSGKPAGRYRGPGGAVIAWDGAKEIK